MSGELREKQDGAEKKRLRVRVWLRMLSCSTVVEKRLRLRFVEQFDTTLPRFDVLATLKRYPQGATMGELSRALLVSGGNVTMLIRQLEADGLVTRAADKADKRTAIVKLTPLGSERFEVLAGAHHGWIENMLSGLSKAELNQLYQLLHKLKLSIAADKS